MAGEDASLPKVTLDVHAEIGPRRRAPTISRNERRRTAARFYFNKIIASHYRDQSQEYSDVASLFITWEANDLHLHEKDSEASLSLLVFKAQSIEANVCADITCLGGPAEVDIRLGPWLQERRL
jgi:hypothetical protein